MNLSWQTLLAVGSGGFLGAILRYYLSMTISENYPFNIPVATLSANIIGSFLIGIFAAIFMTYVPSNELRGFLIVGFLGALTTFSTFALQSFYLFETSFSFAIINILLNTIGTIISVAIGYKLILYVIK